MPVRHYGIYLAYPPSAELRDQGLGRYLVMFLKGAESLPEVRFTVVCPSWTRGPLEALFESEQVAPEGVRIVTPDGKPYALRLFEALRARRTRPRREGWLARVVKSTTHAGERLWERLAARAVAVHSAVGLVRSMPEVVLLLILLAPFLCLAILLAALTFIGRTLGRVTNRLAGVVVRGRRGARARISAVLASPQKEGWVLRLFDEMHRQEMRRMHAKIADLVDVRAWYCPTAYWPTFHEIGRPRLMCVPDVVLSEFPTGFASVGGDRLLGTFERVERAIRTGERYVTYSEAIKWNTLVDRYAIPAAKITVIRHAPNLLNRHLEVSGFPDNEASSHSYCQTLLRCALQRSANPDYTSTFANGDVRFLFYASQFRPNKNVLTLLRAFEHLLRKRYLGDKLILTGNTRDMPEIGCFVTDHRLERDVIFLHGLRVPELAACYKLADLAVNPTISEGGCPFTFTEALSVGTPVVMSRIAVAEEVLTDPRVQEVTFFDPFDWRDCAARIEWAVTHREELLAIQHETFAVHARRTWQDVVAEHVSLLDSISDAAMQVRCE